VKKIVQKSEIEYDGGRKHQQDVLWWGTISMCSPCVVCCCFWQKPLMQLSIKKKKTGWLAYINISSNLSNAVLLSFNNAVLFCFDI